MKTFSSNRRLKALVWLVGTASFTLLVIQSRIAVSTNQTNNILLPIVENDTEKEHVEPPEVRPEVNSPCTREVDTDTVHVIVIADGKSFIGMLTLANSIVQNTASDVTFHFVTFPEDAAVLRRWISGSSLKSISHEIIFLSPERLQGKYRVRSPRKDLASPMNFARILLPDLLPCVGKVIFIDADCLVLGDIWELYTVQMAENHMVAGVSMCDFNRGRKWPTIGLVLNNTHPQVQKSSIPRDSCMMNGGMYVADLLRWERYNISQQLQFWMELNTKEPVFRYGDMGSGTQAVLNAVLHDKYTSAPKEWNTVSGHHKHVQNPKLIHWNGLAKPWLYPTVPFFQEWMKYHVPDPDNNTLPRNLWQEKKRS